jgi:hypothetical protein
VWQGLVPLSEAMRLLSKGLFIVCALLATLLLAAGGGAGGTCRTDCSADDVACACVCHDNAALYSHPDLFTTYASAEIVCAEDVVADSLIPHDIFRPPTV